MDWPPGIGATFQGALGPDKAAHWVQCDVSSEEYWMHGISEAGGEWRVTERVPASTRPAR